ncbi:hypothetical protein [Urbifossiella limnaea]|uniref:Uncharacterized protein n=1 Tax=Urbifossiella limnaea TaxID=2528023 RepID=A0A517XVX1_9BACT|nr:hypothetical protein [Urbifossiella limnaea]QDU21639.1 hypothetical protein ETAA1_36100 [Urbifossiella limnaea]
MIRAVVPGLLCLLAAPAAAQPPAPQPAPPARPIPVQRLPPQTLPGQALPPQAVPAQPLPPQAFTFPAQPAPWMPNGGGGGEPRVVVAKVVDGALVYKSNTMGPVQRQLDVTVLENGQPVTRKQTVTMMQQTTKDVTLPLDGLKVKDAAGKKIQPLNLELRLGDGKGVVLHTGPLPDAIRAMFKDDAVFVETTAGAGQFAAPVFTTDFAPAGGGVPSTVRIRPAPVVEDAPVPIPGRPARPVTPPPAPPQP